MTESERADAWLEVARSRSRRKLAEAGMSADEIERFMADYETELQAWKRERLLAVQREYVEIADGEFHASALRLWDPAETNSRMH